MTNYEAEREDGRGNAAKALRRTALCYVYLAAEQGVGGRLAALWFRIHHAERRVGQARHLVIAFTRSNGA
ncbi:MAG: hypothetical protein ABSF71_09670 [Terriglobia bacterium]|jgi:hypothetical protein